MKATLVKATTALRAFFALEGDLLDVDVNERTLTHKLAEHLQAQFPEWHVDCEYNRRREDTKVLPRERKVSTADTDGRTIYPDIIVHHRRTDDNLLVIEVKKTTNRDNRDDVIKLKALTEPSRGFAYRCGLHLVIDCGTKSVARATAYIGGRTDDGLTAWLKEKLPVQKG